MLRFHPSAAASRFQVVVADTFEFIFRLRSLSMSFEKNMSGNDRCLITHLFHKNIGLTVHRYATSTDVTLLIG